MDDVKGVDVGHPLQDGFHHDGYLLLCEWPPLLFPLLNQTCQTPSLYNLHHDVDPPLGLYHIVVLDHVGVVDPG